MMAPKTGMPCQSLNPYRVTLPPKGKENPFLTLPDTEPPENNIGAEPTLAPSRDSSWCFALAPDSTGVR